jgi:hypothetical protein
LGQIWELAVPALGVELIEPFREGRERVGAGVEFVDEFMTDRHVGDPLAGSFGRF